jgi:hypothetical protein
VVLGEDFVVQMLLALGAAMCVGNVLAIVRPRDRTGRLDGDRDGAHDSDLAQAPRGRSIAFAVIGAVVAIAALAALVID